MKIVFKNPKNTHGVTLEGTGLVLGKPIQDENSNFIGLKNPRIARIGKDDQGNPSLFCVSFMGEPDDLYFTKTPIYVYEVKDKRVLNKYIESTTGITMVEPSPILSCGTVR